jgi:hypothetical protein
MLVIHETNSELKTRHLEHQCNNKAVPFDPQQYQNKLTKVRNAPVTTVRIGKFTRNRQGHPERGEENGVARVEPPLPSLVAA